MRTLFITRDAPYPPLSGSPLRNWLHINALARLGPVGVFSVGHNKHGGGTIPGVEFWRHHSGGEPPRSSLAAVSASMRRIFKPNEFPIKDDRELPKINASLRETLEVFRPDIVVLGNWEHEFPSVLAEFAIPIIVDQHSMEFLGTADALRAPHSILDTPRRLFRHFRTKRRERTLLEAAKQVWMTSEFDASHIPKLTKRVVDHRVIPNAVNIEHYAGVRSGTVTPVGDFPKRAHTICFVGIYTYKPNAEAAEILLEEIFPPLRQQFPDARLLLMGRDPTIAIQRAADRIPGAHVTGTVADTRPYLAAADVCVVPLLKGGGTRLKILEALACGIPVVTTTKGCEGLSVSDGEHLLIRNDPASIIEATSLLWQDGDRARAISTSGYNLVSREYSWEGVFAKVHSAIRALT